MVRLSVFASLLFVLPAFSQAPKPIVRWPVIPVAAAPVDPGTVPKLSVDRLYVIASDAPAIVHLSPKGLAKVTASPGPITVFAKFIDGGAGYEERTFKEKNVWRIQSLGTEDGGRMEIAYIPVGATTDEEIIVKTVDVEGNKGPQPPPDKPPPDKPPPDPQPVPVKPLYYFLIVRPDGPASPEFTKVMSDPAWAELQKAGHSVKDKTLTDAGKLGLTLPVGQPLPTVVTLVVSADGTKSKVVRGPINLPTTSDGIRRLPEGVTP